MKDKPQIRHSRLQNSELSEKRKPPALPPFQDVLDPNDSDMDDNMFTRSDVSEFPIIILELNNMKISPSFSLVG